MTPKQYRDMMIRNVVKRSGICRQTVEQVLPAFIDEVRHQLVEGVGCVPIESFGLFQVKDLPERQIRRKKQGDVVTLRAHRVMEFRPTPNMRRDVESGHVDTSRRSFEHHPDEWAIRARKRMKWNGVDAGIEMEPK